MYINLNLSILKGDLVDVTLKTCVAGINIPKGMKFINTELG